MPTIKTELDGH